MYNTDKKSLMIQRTLSGEKYGKRKQTTQKTAQREKEEKASASGAACGDLRGGSRAFCNY